MATPVTQSQTIAARIESGRILDVDISTYTVSATTEFTKKPVTGIKFATPYQHYSNGEGIYFMPEIGSLCWLCFPSDHNRPFVIAWGPATVDGDARSKKKDLNPGDIYLGTRDENFLILRRGGVVQIGGGPLCQRIFLPINNTIKDFCENYGLHTLGGDLEWSVQRDENTTDGTRPAQLALKAREFADDAKPIAELLIGSHGSGDNRILSLLVKASGQDGAASKVELSIGKDGNVQWTVQQDVAWEVHGNYNVTADQDIKFASQQNVNIEAQQQATLKGQAGVRVEATGGTVDISGAPLVRMGSIVQAGGTLPVAMATPLMSWLASHMHQLTVPVAGASTTPPIVPPLPSIVSQSCFAK